VLLGRPIQSLMVEGGPRLHGQFYEQGLFDVMHGWIAPLWLGQSRYAWLHESSKALHDAERMHLLQAQPLGNDVLCEWVPLERP
jgi:riboflavin biosynthesis pyrimidine reductase